MPHAELVGERQHAVLGRPDPLPAELDDRAVGERVVEDAPAHAVAGLQHDDAAALLLEAAGGRQAGEAGPDDDDINGVHGDLSVSLVNGVQAVSATAGTVACAGRRTSATTAPAAAAATSSQGSALIQPTVLPVRVP